MTVDDLQKRDDWAQLIVDARHRQPKRTARRLGIDHEAARLVLIAIRAHLDESEEPEPEADPVEERGLKDEVTRLRRQVRNSQREEYAHRLIREVAFKLAGTPAKPPTWTYRTKHRKGMAGIPTLMLSDLHWGEVVRSVEVDGLNEYNIAIAQQRLRRVVETTCDLLQSHIVSPGGYPGIVLALGGDMVSGGIHDELLATDELPPIPAVCDLRDHLVWAIGVLADEFGAVYVPSVCGNHDRNTRSKHHKRRVHHSYGWLLGNMLQCAFASDDRVTVQVSEQTDLFYTLGNTRYMLTHGDSLGTRGGDGIIGILGPVKRGRAKIGTASRALGREFDVMIMGHYHTLSWLNDVIVNGSLKGFCEYAKTSRFRPEPAQQALWLTSPKHGITLQMPVLADSRGGEPTSASHRVRF